MQWVMEMGACEYVCGNGTRFTRKCAAAHVIRTFTSSPDRTHEFGPHNGATQKKRRLRLHKGGRLPFEYPHVRVRRLFAQERREDSCHSSDAHLQHVMRGPTGRARDHERI